MPLLPVHPLMTLLEIQSVQGSEAQFALDQFARLVEQARVE
jgi:hypothetical protein